MKRAAQLREEGHEFEVVDEQDDGGEEGESGNRFECPSCGDVVEGYPDECPSCEASYNWN